MKCHDVRFRTPQSLPRGRARLDRPVYISKKTVAHRSSCPSPGRRKASKLLPETPVLRRFQAMPPPSAFAVPGSVPVQKRVQNESTKEYYLLHIVPDRPAVVRDSARDSARDGAQSRGRVAMCREMSCFVMVRFSSSAPSPPVISTGAERRAAERRYLSRAAPRSEAPRRKDFSPSTMLRAGRFAPDCIRGCGRNDGEGVGEDRAGVRKRHDFAAMAAPFALLRRSPVSCTPALPSQAASPGGSTQTAARPGGGLFI